MAAGLDEDNLLAPESILQLEGGGEGGGACAFGEIMGLFQEKDDGPADFVIFNGDEIIQVVTHDAEGNLFRYLNPDAFREGGHRGADQLTFPPRQIG